MALLHMIPLVPLLVWLAYKFLNHYRTEQFKALPRMRPDLIWGHMKVVGEYVKASEKGRKGAHEDYAFKKICDDLGSPPLFVLDMRPLFYPMCIINSHQVMEQIAKPSKTFKYSVLKSPTMKWLEPLMGPTSIMMAEGEDWKPIRKRFNPGFAPTHLVTLLPAILAQTERFTNRLDALAKSGEEFQLGELCTYLTFDIIGAVVLDEDFKAQTTDQHPIVQEYLALTAAFEGAAPFNFPFGPTRNKRQRLGKAVDKSIKTVVTQKFEQQLRARKEGQASHQGRSVIDLSLQDTSILTPEILQETTDQVKSFIFAGHDTTSILLQWAFYTLSTHPQILQKLTFELDSVFGPSTLPSSVSAQFLERGEECLKQLPYTSAIIKETLRLFPPASTARLAPKGSGYKITDPQTGDEMCLDGFMIYGNHYIIGRDKSVYGENADEFVPERWLGDTETSTFPSPSSNLTEKSEAIPPTAWRPFERGPRNCIGQELANIEARLILACSVRHYRFSKVGVGALKVDGMGRVVMGEKGVVETEGVMYNRRQVTAKPFDDMRMRVAVRER
ncbi:hypothetical protein EG327_007200 [Venturia inaequalis]|uniref:Uncharacterized protein n=1 Tax=Venturia inaequalis TaxID=5025 RepID=A0A8H3YYW5_VENIN|nr:hypothetical protein EG327_007200 [Venturia inaequalis]